MAYYTYILRCSDGTLYTGYASALQERVEAHNNKKGAKYTRGRLPVTLVYSCSFESKSEAMKEEHRIKKLTKQAKNKIITGTGLLTRGQSPCQQTCP